VSPELRRQLERIAGDAGWLPPGAAAERGPAELRAAVEAAAGLVRPRTTAEVAAVLRACAAAAQPVTVQGGLTGLVRGAEPAPGDLVLSLERMRAIEIDPVGRTAVAEAGATVQALQEAAEERGLAFPLDLGSRGTATVGGVVATNAGGNRVLRYGMTRELTLGLEVVLADGTVLSSLNRLLKNNSGYDLKQLFVGSEGTLGVVTRAALRLRERPRSEDVALLAAPSFPAVVALLRHVDRALGGHLSAFEVMWRDHFELVTTPPALGASPVARGAPLYVLVEAQGASPEADGARLVEALEEARAEGLVVDAAVARSRAQRAALWAIRDDVGQLRRLAPIHVFDVSLPIAAMEGYVDEVRGRLLARWPAGHCSVFGHLGDGNLHVVFAPRAGAAAEATRAGVEEIVYRPLAAVGGAVSAEHGIGLEKKGWLGITRTPGEVALMALLKRTLDPRGILNRGKVVDAGEGTA
jgi:FAD/FMN-containing dehydrogenase